MDTKFFLLFFIIIITKLINSYYKLYRINKIYNMYTQWLSNDDSPYIICRYKVELEELASVTKPKIIHYIHPLDQTYISKGYASAIDQFPTKRQDFSSAIIQIIEESIGYYRYQISQSINPIYWIELIIWFPKKFINFLGLNNEIKHIKTISVISQIFYWSMFILKFFGYDVVPFLQHILTK